MYFSFFNEIGIISQLSNRLLEAHLPDGFLISHFSVLNHLCRRGDRATPLALATAFQVPKTTMSHTLAGLEKAALIEFVPNPEDGRSKCVVLTAKGRAFRDKAIAMIGPDLARIAADISEDKIAEALPVLEAVRTYLDRMRDK